MTTESKIFDNGISRPESLKHYYFSDPEVIHLNGPADMDFPLAPAIKDALYESVSDIGYTVVPHEAYEAVRNWLQQQYKWQIQPEWIVWIGKFAPAIADICRITTHSRETVLTFTPAYVKFFIAVRQAGRELLTLPLAKNKNRFTLNSETITQDFDSSVKLLLLCHPHNPVGKVYKKKELERVAEAVLKNDGYICSDEIYSDLVFDNNAHIPIASLSPEVAERTITLMSTTKTFNLANFPCSYAIIPNPELRKRFQDSQLDSLLPVIGHKAAVAAYQHSHAWYHAVREYLQKNRDVVVSQLEGIPELKVYYPEATFLAWIDARALMREQLVSFFLKKAKVELDDGSWFGVGAETQGFLRLNFALPRPQLAEGLRRMKQVLTIV